MKQFNSFKRTIPGSILGIIVLISTISTGTPKIQWSTTLVTPRLLLMDTTNTTAWRSLLVVRQGLGDNGQIFSSMEYGSSNFVWYNPFRIHQLYWRQKMGSSTFKLGRITQWNSLRNLRIDGGEFQYRLHKHGILKVMAGVKAVIDFSDTAFVNHPEWVVSWAKGSWGKSIEVSAWSEYFETTAHNYTGITFQTKVLGFRYGQALSFDLDENQVHHIRARLSKMFGRRIISFGYRQKRYNPGELYTWVDKPIVITPTAFLETQVRKGNHQTWNQFTYRFQKDLSLVWTSAYEQKGFSASLITGKRANTFMVGTSFGYRKPIFEHLTADVSASIHSLNYGDLSEPSQSSSLLGTLSWDVSDGVQIRMFGRYASNPVYKTDGRGGVTINVSL